MTMRRNVGSARLVVAGLGFAGTAAARAAAMAGWRVAGTARDPARVSAPSGVEVVPFGEAGPAIAAATHLLATAAPEQEFGDPVLAAHADAIRSARDLRWIGYVSTTGVYGDHGGGWVDETTPPTPMQDRSRRRVAAEAQWAAFASRLPVDVFRCGGIYGPGRSVLDELRDGTARRTMKPGHAFSRIHRDDIALAVLAAMRRDGRAPGCRVLHLVDDEPAESAVVVEAAARLLGMEPPPPVPIEEALPRMSPMGRSFWGENRRVANAATKAALGIAWRYPTWREGLTAILREERREGAP
jgi:nucleoside-diphosphate-sugar epimerase